jgi:hypothetical protein
MGSDPVWENRIGAFKNGNFLISFYFWDSTLRGILFDNSGNNLLVGGSAAFDIDGTVASEFQNRAIVPLPNGNMAAFWGIDYDSYYKILGNDGSTVQATQPMDGGRNLGNFIPNNTAGSEGFMATEFSLQDPGDYFGNPYVSYVLHKYNQSGVHQSTESLEGDLIQPSYSFVAGASGGYAYLYSYYKTYSTSDGEYTLTSDRDTRGVTVGLSMSTLPVSLISYSVTLLNTQKAQLNWITSSESNSDYFEIEKSSDGSHFISIGRIDAAGNSTTEKAYSFTDPELLKQKSWYRLKQYDADGKEKDLGIKYLHVATTAASIKVYPNPIKGNEIHVNTGGEQLPVSYKLADAQGRTMKSGTFRQVQQQINVADLPEGIYFLRIGSNPAIKIRK